MACEDDERVAFSHEELLEITEKTLMTLLESDSILKDLPEDVTLEEVAAQLALHHGQSITIYLVKENKAQMPIVVHNNATVYELKRAIKRYVSLQLKRKEGVIRKISWRYVWRNNHLVFEGQPLFDDNAKISEFGIVNRSKVTFLKRRREKNKTGKTLKSHRNSVILQLWENKSYEPVNI